MQLDEYRRNFELEQSYWWFVGVRAMIESMLRVANPRLRLGKVLDVGCGTGAILDQLKPHSQALVGVDISSEAMRYCRMRQHTDLIQTDAVNVPLPSAEFDTITAIGLIEHLNDDDAFLEEMHRLLRADGVFVMLTSSFPYLWSMHDEANHHKRRYYLRSLQRKIHSAGFRTVRFSHLNFVLFPLLAAMLLLHRTIYGLRPTHTRRLLPIPPSAINRILTGVLLVEARLMRAVRLPWGISMIGVFRKTHD